MRERRKMITSELYFLENNIVSRGVYLRSYATFETQLLFSRNALTRDTDQPEGEGRGGIDPALRSIQLVGRDRFAYKIRNR